MKYTVCTTFNAEGYKTYGRRMIQTFLQTWPQDILLRVYAEECQVTETAPNLQVLDLPYEDYQTCDNCILWSGNHIGHRTVVKNNVFISSHVVLSGYCVVEDNCYFGVNATVHNNINIAKDCIVGAGSMIRKDTMEGLVYVGVPAQAVQGKTSLDVKF